MLSHVDSKNRPTMVDVGDKAVTTRTATARAVVVFPPDVVVRSGEALRTKKGPVFDTAIIAGVMAAKRTHELIPFCHPIALEDCKIAIEWGEGNEVVIECSVRATHKTGVEMEALTGASDGRADDLRHVQGADARHRDPRGRAAREVGRQARLRRARRDDGMTIEVTARYFAAFRERAGRDSERVSTEARTAADLYGELARRHGFADSIDALQGRDQRRARGLERGAVARRRSAVLSARRGRLARACRSRSRPPSSIRLRASVSSTQQAAGACVTFEGWVRNHNEGEAVQALEYEAHQAIAEKEGARIVAEAMTRFAVTAVHCEHRVGKLGIGDCAVWVGVSADHRGAAFDACRYVIDETKARVPIWKKEHYASGATGWVNCATRTS